MPVSPGTVGGCLSWSLPEFIPGCTYTALLPGDVSSLAFLSGAVLRSPHQTKPKYTPPCYSLFLTVGHSKRCHPFYSAKNAEILLYLIDFLVFRSFYVDRLGSIGQTIFRNKHQRCVVSTIDLSALNMCLHFVAFWRRSQNGIQSERFS